MPLEGVSTELKISLPCLLVGAILFFVSFAEPHWMEETVQGGSVYLGLWETCGSSPQLPGGAVCVSYGGDQAGWLTGVEVLECFSLSATVTGVALTFSLLFKRQRLFCLLGAVGGICAGILGLIGAIVFAGKNDNSDYLGWAFYLNVVGDLLIGAGGGAVMVYYFRMRSGYVPVS
ncbi:hypothetical protein BaRGS_00004127 [Batillaria attramentaria]|uniref:DUF4203 domain-containing protein n=1 Tax=Batillaria attramentaria TaxID=370345 RepID=A0ABD0LYT3_9CAEN